MTEAPRGRAIDSGSVTEEIARGGTWGFYLRTLLSNPRKIFVGVRDTLVEIAVFVLRPREALPFPPLRRAWLVVRFLVAELRVPGATSVLETLWLVYALARVRSTAPDWVEVGCFKGLSTVRLSLLAELLDRRLSVFDTFAGLPGEDAIYETVNRSPPYHFRKGSYRAARDEVERNLRRHGRPERVRLVAGDVRETLSSQAPPRVAFAFLDVDLEESYRACFEGLARSLDAGSVIVIAEAAFRPIRALVEATAFWQGLALAPPRIVYIHDRFGIPSCHNLAFLEW